MKMTELIPEGQYECIIEEVLVVIDNKAPTGHMLVFTLFCKKTGRKMAMALSGAKPSYSWLPEDED